MTHRSVRAVFISDIHLANLNSQVDLLADFLNNTDMDQLYLLGDIVDLWKLSTRKGRWHRRHEKILQLILAKARNGTEVTYVPGNHDPFFRHFADTRLGPIRVEYEAIHTAASGERYLLLHGDRFDDDIYCGHFWWHLGEWAYESVVTLNRYLNKVRARFGKPYWSLPGALKMRSKKAQAYIDSFEAKVVSYAKQQGVQGVVCGHIHQSKLHIEDGFVYANDGDWVESCSALLEHHDGSLELIQVPHRQGEPRIHLHPSPTWQTKRSSSI
ncbi:UDP-2,3-diacylglucosamine diphosphatase [Saccharospirillum salsuginis]|uniref:UDP-2,3-diacylglucosamine hydrolase n=1 Tax=Saccharospirillum salsuginis TaxID=418750 RepID=A0A918N6L7_9GAMM|nr:UDP-2,3-diacylglucosamine diphosphatase [Saccharospirillum salsuginis]GGX39740.1 UDP-2,3-diacylglucosamine hydrolase [Saccharospirillum salsuginis]